MPYLPEALARASGEVPGEPAPPALDREVAEELWDLSIKLGGLA